MRDGLQLEQDLDFERTQWRVARATWTVLLIVMAATVLGLFGNGPLSSARIQGSQPGFAVEYARFARFGSTLRMIVHVPVDAQGTIRFSLPHTFLRAFHVQTITPDPVETRLVADGVEYQFEGGAASPLVMIELQPVQRGVVQGVVQAAAGTLQFWQFIYP